MKSLALVILALLGCGSVLAVDCSSPPQGFGGAWAREYQSWCEQCCGTYSSAGPSCNPGPNWGCGGSQGGTAQPGYDSQADEGVRQEAARKRRMEAERRRREEEKAEAARQADFERKRDEITKDIKGISEDDLGLKGLPDDEPRLRGLDDPAPAKSAVVKKDAAKKTGPPDFPGIDGIERSPGHEAWLRGMDAVVAQDWQLALAWFKTAKQKDPLNPVLGRAVQVAEWTWDARKSAALRSATPRLMDAPKNEDLELLFFPRTVRPKGSLQVPDEKDAEFLFDFDKEEDELIRLAFPGYKRHAPAKIDPDWANPKISAAARTAYADQLAVQALLLVDRKDYAGAVALLEKAEKQAPHIVNYRNTRLLVQKWANQKK